MRSRAARGFSLFELAVVATIFAILVGVLLQRVGFYQDEAERAAVERTIGSLRAALANQQAALALHGGEERLAALLVANPVVWLLQPPSNYLGEYYAPKPGQIKPGSWYFDPGAKTLVYQPTRDQDRLRYQVRFVPPSRRSLDILRLDGQ
ncbi:MAG: type II secretion system protein [Pseudomonadota bacterium]